MIGFDPTPISPPRGLYIMAGQSNMVGHGALAQVPDFPLGYRVHIYRYSEQWTLGSEPMSDHTGIVHQVFYDNEDLASCGMAFGKEMARLNPGVEIGLVPCAKGGAGMVAWAAGGALYNAMLARLAAALQHPGSVLRGVVHVGFEEDSRVESDALACGSRFAQWVADLRSDTGVPDLPVVFAQLGSNPNVAARPYWSIVQAQQAAISIPGVTMIAASDLSKLPDNLHYDTPALVTLGWRAAVAMAGLAP